MPPKRTKFSGTSSSALSTAVATKFVNDAAQARFERAKMHRQAITERGFGLFAHGHSVQSMIKNRGWGQFCKQPNAAVLPIVREFYANAAELEEGKSWVRGKFVMCDADSLNALFGLETFDDSAFQALYNDPDCELVIDTLCFPGSTWQRQEAHNHFPERSLTINNALWYGFLTRRLMPVSHTTDVQRERAVVLYAIATGVPIDVGKLLYSQLMISVRNGHLGFFFPSMITDLCIRAGVEIAVDDEWLQPMKAIDDAYANTKAAARVSRRQESTVEESSSAPLHSHTTPPPASSAYYAPPPPQPRRRNLADRMDDIGAFVMHQNNYNAINSAHMQYMEAMMQGMALNMGMDPSIYPPPPPYPPPFTFPYSFPGPDQVGGVPPPQGEEGDEP